MFCDFMSARAVRNSDFTQISLFSGRHRNATALTRRKCPSVECSIVRNCHSCSVRPRITPTVRTVDGGIQRNNENHIERTFQANLWCVL